MTTKKKTSAGKRAKKAARPAVDLPFVLLLWFFCDGKDCKVHGKIPAGARDYGNDIKNVFGTAYDSSEKSFIGRVLCRGLLSSAEATFPTDKWAKLEDDLGEALKQFFTSCQNPIHLLLPLGGTNRLDVYLYPAGREEIRLPRWFSDPIGRRRGRNRPP